MRRPCDRVIGLRDDSRVWQFRNGLTGRQFGYPEWYSDANHSASRLRDPP
jgi:hypothetical protein